MLLSWGGGPDRLSSATRSGVTGALLVGCSSTRCLLCGTVLALVDEVFDFAFVEHSGADADLVVEAFDFEADDAVEAGPPEEAEEQGAGIFDLVAGVGLAPVLDLCS